MRKEPPPPDLPAAGSRKEPKAGVQMTAAETGAVIDLAQLTIRLKTILVPVDFSPPSQKALHYALSFAEQFRATVSLLYVLEPAIYPTELGYVPAELDAMYQSVQAGGRERLVALAESQIPSHLRAQTLLRLGQPHREITQAAKELKVDLIVIATHGYTGLKHTLLGSTAERVVRHAPCPVLTVREREHDFV